MIDPEFPDVAPVAESILGCDEFLGMMKAVPDLAVYLDVKVQEPLTASADAYAQAIFSRWKARGLSNLRYLGGPIGEALDAYRKHASAPFTRCCRIRRSTRTITEPEPASRPF